MNTAEWILVCILSLTLFVFLVTGIIVLIKAIKLIDETRDFVETGRQFAEKGKEFAETANGVANNLVNASLVGGLSSLVRKIVKGYNKNKKN